MNVIEQLEAEQAARLPGAKISDFQAGDTVVVNVKVTEGDRTRVQAYEGVCIARSGGGLNESFTVRKISYGEGVERVFPVYSPMIDSVRVVRRGKVRRAKLYYLRDRRGKSARIAERTETPAAREAAKEAAKETGTGQGTGQGTGEDFGGELKAASEASRRRVFWEEITMAEPVVAQKAPFAKELEAGKTYYWCACGRSANQPFCDGSHKAVGMAPTAFTAEKSGTAYLCGCKTSKNAPYCDGSHKSL